MRKTVVFKEWAPDQPDLGPEVLTIARNVIPSPSGYKCFKTFEASAITTPSSVPESVYVANGQTKGSFAFYLSTGNAGTIYMSPNFTAFTSLGGSTTGVIGTDMVQYENLMVIVGTGHQPYKHTVGSTSTVSALASVGTAPACNVVGVIGQFVVIGDLLTTTVNSTQRANAIQWSGVDQPTSWPTPGSATAIAQQSGEQLLPAQYGRVMGIHGGDQFGIVFQIGATNRMTYEGPPTVFRFETIDNVNGSAFKKGSCQVGGVTYFISRNGFCRTDGVAVERIGVGKVDKFFWDSVNGTVNSGYDPLNNLVQWAFPTGSALTTCNRLMSYNIDTGSWSYCDVSISHLVTPAKGLTGQATMRAVGTSFIGSFVGTAGSAVFETSDAEFNPGGRTYVDGIKPNVESSATAPAVTVAIGYRDSLSTDPSYTSEVTATAATGFADFRVDAKYTRARITIDGNFDKVTGFVANLDPSSDR